MIWKNTCFQDLMAIQLDECDADIRDQFSDSDEMRYLLHENARSMFTPEGKAIAVVGVWPMHKGVGLAWTLLSAEARSHPVALHRGTSRWLDYIEERDQYWRIQSTVDPRFPRNREWLIRLGFIYEGRMRCYGPQREDHDLYARVRN